MLELWGGESYGGILGGGHASPFDDWFCGLVHASGCDGSVTTLTGRNFDASSLHLKGDSSDVCERIFELHFPDPALVVCDMTYGTGVFWKWFTERGGIRRTVWKNDILHRGGDRLPVEEYELGNDFRDMHSIEDGGVDIAVFDPPFMSSGETQYRGYGTNRKNDGAPQNRKDIRADLALGMREAMRIARSGIIVKAQIVVESRQTWNNPLIPELMLEASPEWYLDDVVYQHTAKRRQPPDRRVEHFQGKPSVWLIAKRRSKPRPNPELLNWLRELSDTIV